MSVCVCACVRASVCVRACVRACVCVCVCVCVYTDMQMCVGVQTVHRFPLLYNCLCVHVFVCMVVDGFLLSISGSTPSLLDKVKDL